MTRSGPVTRSVLGLFALGMVTASAGAGQEIRVSGSTSLRYVEVRPFVRDSVLAEEVRGSGLLRQTAEGAVVRCVAGATFCRGTRPGRVTSVLPAVQDLEASAWGFGEGVRLYGQLRGRAAWGGTPDLWPRAEDAFDLLAAYGEVDRERFRFRVGRQWTTSGLGFYNFDGVALAVRPLPGLSVEGKAGRSLVRGLNEPRTGDALAALDDLAPTEPGIMLAAQVRYRPSPRLALAALYHRDVRRDRAGLYSELGGVQGVYRFAGASVEGEVESDLATRRLNEARLRVRVPPVGSVLLSAETRRYRPYFELWTIWGAFSPVGFDEGRLRATWASGSGLRGPVLGAEASYRRYHDTGTGVSVGGLRTDGWGLGVDGHWSPRDRWRLEGAYRVEVGFGGARSEAHGAARRQLGDRGHLAFRGTAFQRLYEFRLDEGVVLGAGGDAAFRTSERSRVSGGLTLYRHLARGVGGGTDWNQLRGNLRVDWVMGPEPGVPSGGGGP